MINLFTIADHGGLAFTSSFCFESAIRHAQARAHGSNNLASQIAFWIDAETIIPRDSFRILPPRLVNEIRSNHSLFNRFRSPFTNALQRFNKSIDEIQLFLRFKATFCTYHSIVFDQKYTCCSYIVCYNDDLQKRLYGNIVIFFSCKNVNYCFIQRYQSVPLLLSDRLDLPRNFKDKIDSFYPILEIGTDYDIVETKNIICHCVSIPYENYQCITDRRVPFEHD